MEPDYKSLSSKWLLVILVVFAILLLNRLGSWGVMDTSEARYAEVARKMYLTGDYLHPVYMGIEHYHKPPMTYWITAAAFHFFGVTPFAARFFPLIALILQITFIYRISLLLFENPSAARFAAFAYASFIIVWVSVLNLTTDVYLNTFLLLATWSILSYLIRSKIGFIYSFSFFIALAFLTKITAVFIFMGALFLFIIWQYRDKIHFSRHMITASLLLVIVILPWFLLLEAEGKPILKYMLYDQSVKRYLSDAFDRDNPVYFYALAVIFLTFPWFIMVTKRMLRWKIKFNMEVALFISGFLLPVVFFSFSQSKLLLYILPAFWVLAVLAGNSLDQMQEKMIVNWMHWQGIWIILVFTILLSAPLADSSIMLSKGLYSWALLSLLFFLYLYRSRKLEPKDKFSFLNLSLTLAIIIMSMHFLPSNQASSSSGKVVADWIKLHQHKNKPIFIFDQLAPSLTFHLNKEVALVGKNQTRELQFETNDAWKKIYYDLNQEERKKALITSLQIPSVLICRTKKIADIDPMILQPFAKQHQEGIWTVFY